jgi:FkbM family methyltransferase
VSDSPLWHYIASFDAVATIERNALPRVGASAGFLTNFLGVRIDPKFLPRVLAGREGQIEPLPLPANWHADIAEWAAVLRAVELAKDDFTVVELGCGWGCWMNNSGVAAKRRGLSVHVIGIEGDEGHIGFARESLVANGFGPPEITLHRGVAAAYSGIALFPRQTHSGTSWGQEPIFGVTEEQRRHAMETRNYDELPMIALEDVVREHRRIDLLHVDIQGGEADLIQSSAALLREKFAYLVIGTHSRQIEGRLFDTLLKEGWHLEIERPAILNIEKDLPSVTVDGVQGWRNPRLFDKFHDPDGPADSRRTKGLRMDFRGRPERQRDHVRVTGEVRNTGTCTWLPSTRPITGTASAGDVNIGVHLLDRRGSRNVADYARRELSPAQVAPGESVAVDFTIAFPAGLDHFTLEIDLVAEHVAWFEVLGSAPLRVDVDLKTEATVDGAPQ